MQWDSSFILGMITVSFIAAGTCRDNSASIRYHMAILLTHRALNF